MECVFWGKIAKPKVHDAGNGELLKRSPPPFLFEIFNPVTEIRKIPAILGNADRHEKIGSGPGKLEDRG